MSIGPGPERCLVCTCAYKCWPSLAHAYMVPLCVSSNLLATGALTPGLNCRAPSSDNRLVLAVPTNSLFYHGRHTVAGRTSYVCLLRTVPAQDGFSQGDCVHTALALACHSRHVRYEEGQTSYTDNFIPFGLINDMTIESEWDQIGPCHLANLHTHVSALLRVRVERTPQVTQEGYGCYSGESSCLVDGPLNPGLSRCISPVVDSRSLLPHTQCCVTRSPQVLGKFPLAFSDGGGLIAFGACVLPTHPPTGRLQRLPDRDRGSH
eukprot:9709-Prorocentrum_minimum.AAC.6